MSANPPPSGVASSDLQDAPGEGGSKQPRRSGRPRTHTSRHSGVSRQPSYIRHRASGRSAPSNEGPPPLSSSGSLSGFPTDNALFTRPYATPSRKKQMVYATKCTPFSEGAGSSVQEVSHHKDVPALKERLTDELVYDYKNWNKGRKEDIRIFAASQSANEQNINDYLRIPPLYSGTQRRWTRLKDITKEDFGQYYATVAIINSILTRFHGDTKRRKAYVTANRRLIGYDERQRKLRSCPDLMVAGAGKAASCKKTTDVDPTYATCVSLWELKYKKKFTRRTLIRLAVYAREVFIQCQNRQFVYGVVLTETFIILVRFDRTGARYSDPINIHLEPEIFVRIVLGVSSLDDDSVGYISAVRWNDDGSRSIVLPPMLDPTREGDVTRSQGVFTAVPDENGVFRPFFIRPSIRGRGTTCWLVRDEHAKMLVVKFSSRSIDRAREWEFLKAAKGIEGVGQVCGFLDLARTPAPSDGSNGCGGSMSRVLSCAVLEGYGTTVKGFKSRRQLLWAIHDAIKGHLGLSKKGILHRDVSERNVLLGDMNRRGWRGVLIDVDLAIFFDGKTEISKGLRTGTRAFQSINVLQGKGHDHWDDLESFLYVLTWVLASAKRKGRCIVHGEPPSAIKSWEDLNVDNARLAKEAFISKVNLEFQLQATLVNEVAGLINELRMVIRDHVAEKEVLMQTAENRGEAYQRATNGEALEEDYSKFLKPILHEIERLDEEASSLGPDPAGREFPAPDGSDPDASPESLTTGSKKRASSSVSGSYMHSKRRKVPLLESSSSSAPESDLQSEELP